MFRRTFINSITSMIIHMLVLYPARFALHVVTSAVFWLAVYFCIARIACSLIKVPTAAHACRGVATGVDIGIYTPKKISPSKLFMG